MALTVNTKIVNDVDNYSLDAKQVKGGYGVVATYADLSSLPAATIIEGSLYYCQADDKFYKYNGSAWEEAEFGGGNVDDVKVNGTSVVTDKVANITAVPASIVTGTLTDSQISSASTWNAKSTVSAASTGTATDEVSYITIDGTEKKLASGGGDDASFGTDDILQFTDGTNTPVEANPTASATEALNKLTVGSTTYSVGGGTWGSIRGTLSNQTDLQSALDSKSVVSGSTTGTSTTEIKYITINGVEWKMPEGSASTGTITVTSLSGATVTIGEDSYTYGAAETTHAFGPYEYGEYTVTATKTGYITKTVTVALVSSAVTCTCIPTRLPSGYTELEYIENTSGQAINTGLVANYGYTLDIRASISSSLSGSRKSLCGTDNGAQITVNPTGGYIGVGNADSANYSVEFDTIHNFKMKFSNSSSNYVYLDNVQTDIARANNQTSTLMIFARNNNSGSPTNFMLCKMYYSLAYDIDGTTLVQNLIPAKRDSDSAIGMYDAVTNTFFTNCGSGTFTPGDPV